MVADDPDPISLARANEPFIKRLAQRMAEDQDLLQRMAEGPSDAEQNEPSTPGEVTS